MTDADSTIWITGASSGLGRALAIQYSQISDALILSGRNIKALELTKDACNSDCHISLLPFEMQDLDRHRRIVEKAIAITGQIDMIIHNAGISQRSEVLETDMKVYQKLMDVNYFGTISLTQLLLPHFVDRQKGQFVVISSLVGKFGSPYRSGYAAAKHALHGFFESLRLEHHEDNIDVTLLCPGFIHTQVSVNALTGDGSKQGSMDEKTAGGLSPEAFAKKAIRAIRRKKKEAYIGKFEIVAIYIKRYIPWLFYKLIKRAAVK